LFRVTLPSATTYLIGLLKDSAIASTIGVMEITYLAGFLASKQFGASLPIFTLAGALSIWSARPLAALARIAEAGLRLKVRNERNAFLLGRVTAKPGLWHGCQS